LSHSVVETWWSSVHGLPVPMREAGKMTVWKGMLSLPMNCGGKLGERESERWEDAARETRRASDADAATV